MDYACASALIFRRGLLALGLLAALTGTARLADAGFVTVGTNNGAANVFPFGAPNFYSGEYQQVYTGAAFSGPVTINSVGFAPANLGGPVTDTFTIGLSTTSATVASMSTNYAANKGADFTTVFSGTMTINGSLSGGFTFVIPTSAFLYDPSLGNLLLDVVITSSTGSTNIPFETTVDPVTSRVYNSGGTGSPTFNPNYGLVTQFGVSAVPEPGSVALLSIGGLGLLVGVARRRRNARATA